MTKLSVPNIIWGPAGDNLITYSRFNNNLNDADNKVASIFACPKDGVLDRIGVYSNAVTGTPPSYAFRFEGVDGNGKPDGAAYGGCTAKEADVGTVGFHWVTLDTPATVSRGDAISAVVYPGSTPPDGSNYVQATHIHAGSNRLWPVGRSYTSLWGSPNQGLAAVGVRYQDGVVVVPSISTQYVTFQSDTDPDEVGAKFTVPFLCTCVGLVVGFYPESADGTVRLYGADDTVIASVAIDASKVYVPYYGYYVFPIADATLAADVTYRLAAASGSAVFNTYFYRAAVEEAESRAFWPDGARWQGTQRTDGGAWTDKPLEVPMAGLILSDITVAGGDAPAATSAKHGRVPLSVPVLG